MESKPSLFIISGPNGAGKSTHVQSLLPEDFDGIPAFDRDKMRIYFENQIKGADDRDDQAAEKASSLMEEYLANEMGKAIKSKTNFVLETPLSHPDYWRYIDRFVDNGYQVQLCYLCLDRIADCKHRVCQRALLGGHYVDSDTIKGVYEKNLQHINDYKDTFATIKLYDGMTSPTLLAMICGNEVVYSDKKVLNKSWVKNGLPSLAEKIAHSVESKKKVQVKAKRKKLKKGIH